MAQWKETLEPYVKVIESVKTAALNPTAGGDLILGAVIISDSGPSEPTLITSQSEFLEVYAAEELTKDYVKSLDSLYSSDPGSSLASTMWLNAYRLAGSTPLLLCRASKADGIVYTKPLTGDIEELQNSYIIKDSEILKRVPEFKLVIDSQNSDGWAIAVRDLGVFGNLVDDNGPLYDFYCNNLAELVSTLNDTDKFYSPKYSFYSDQKCTREANDPSVAIAVKFEEVYLASSFLDQSALSEDNETILPDNTADYLRGLAYIFAAEVDWEFSEQEGIGEKQGLINLNSDAYSGFDEFKYYACNLYNSNSELSVEIRRYNHNAVKPTSNGDWEVIQNVLNSNPDRAKDFYEFRITDPSLSSDVLIFNVGSLPGRGDITLEELKSSMSMIHLNLPYDLFDLGLNYYGYEEDNREYVPEGVITFSYSETEGYVCNEDRSWIFETLENGEEFLSHGGKQVIKLHELPNILEKDENGDYFFKVGDEIAVGDDLTLSIYKISQNINSPYSSIEVNVQIDRSKTSLFEVSDEDIRMAWDKIEEDDRYVVEGFTDLGNTYPIIQSYIANIAINSNYFYAFSTTNATNYMTISNKAQKIGKKSHKLYAATPWDYDDGTVGFQFAVSPSVLYWEAVMRNRQNNNEFAGVFGQNTGRVNVMSLAKEFKKSERQLLLSKKINTISYDNYLGSYYFNDNYTFTDDSYVMSEECNSRLQIRISKAMPILLNQFKGRQNTSKTWKEMRETIKFWFVNTIMNYNYTIAEYRIICDETNNKPETIRQNKVFVTIQVRFNSSIKFITVYNDAYPIGVEFSE